MRGVAAPELPRLRSRGEDERRRLHSGSVAVARLEHLRYREGAVRSRLLARWATRRPEEASWPSRARVLIRPFAFTTARTSTTSGSSWRLPRRQPRAGEGRSFPVGAGELQAVEGERCRADVARRRRRRRQVVSVAAAASHQSIDRSASSDRNLRFQLALACTSKNSGLQFFYQGIV